MKLNDPTFVCCQENPQLEMCIETKRLSGATMGETPNNTEIQIGGNH